MKKEQAQRLMAEYTAKQARIESLARQLTLIDASISELNIAKEFLTNLKNMKNDQDILVPIGANILAFGSIRNTKEVLVSIGAEVFAKKSVEDALKYVESKINDLNKAKENIQKEIVSLQGELERIRPELEKILQR